MTEKKDIEILDKIIVGRVQPHIYAFTTNTIPNYLKVGDTYRPVSIRLQEWKKHFPLLQQEFEDSAAISDDVFFRDYSVHQYLEHDLSKHRLLPGEYPHEYYSNEFFKNVQIGEVSDAIKDIKVNYEKGTGKYQYYDAITHLPEIYTYTSTGEWIPRPNQQATIDRFVNAMQSGRTNLLMYAVMRFGKSFTSMCCAKAIDAKVVLVVSAKADVLEEWKKTVESADNFNTTYEFLTSDKLERDKSAVKAVLEKNKSAVLFLTLQDLQGDTIKDKHTEIFGQKIDLLIVDETHYGARAESYGKILRDVKDEKNQHDSDDYVETAEAEEQLKSLQVKITLHLSGTPYRILMGSEFTKDDIIAFYQFSDIVQDQEQWDKDHLLDDENDVKEWDNPYFGFPQMIRFAFVPSKSAIELLESLKKNGATYAFSELLEPRSIKKDKSTRTLHKKFLHETEVLELFEVIDGCREDEGLLSFLDYDKIKEGKMCQHIVCVLPYCASCDALEALIINNRGKFKNLQDYEIINISGVESPNKYKTTKTIKDKIKDCAKNGKKTLTLTVNRMLTGSTVEEWDTMLFMRDTASPQEYDQAIFRLQNQYIREFVNDKGDRIKYNMKPQTLLVDFDPHRMFIMQEKKSQIYNVNTDTSGNECLRSRIERELSISPIISLNANKIARVEAADILAAVSEYSNSRGVLDETVDIPIDMSLLSNDIIKATIEMQAELGSKQGLSIVPNIGKEVDYVEPDNGKSNSHAEDNENSDGGDNTNTNSEKSSDKNTESDIKSLENKFRTYYSRILFFAFLTKSKVLSLSDILACIDDKENTRIANNLGLKKEMLALIREHINIFVLRQLDYKVQNINMLSQDETLEPMQRAAVAIKKFGRISESEITTPDNIATDMINLLPDDCFANLRDNEDGVILDIASKMGEFAVAIAKRCMDMGIALENIKSKVISIPTSSIAYEFTRKVYEILGLDVNAIASNFNSYDLLSIKKPNSDGTEGKNLDYERIHDILSQKKMMCEISLGDDCSNLEECEKMIFEAVVGNPPYQEIVSKSEGNASLGKNLFPGFTKCAMELSRKYVSLIIPSKWFAGEGQDHSFPILREYTKNHNHFRIIRHFNDSDDIFTGAAPGAVNYFLYDISYDGDTLFCNDDSTKMCRPLFEDDIDIILPLNSMVSILKKVTSAENYASLTNITTGRNAFGIIGKNERNISTDTFFPGAYELRCAHEVIKYVSEDKIVKNMDIANHWKIFTSKGNGAAGTLGGNSPVSILGKPYVAKPKSVCTDSLFPIGCFDSQMEAENLAKYLKTKFVRYLAGVMKVTHNITQIVYKFVPIQDFTENSDIDWSKPITEIDRQLYAKYGLDNCEIEFIESMIKPME